MLKNKTKEGDSFTLLFVVHSGNILPSALILAVSLVEKCKTGIQLVAAIPCIANQSLEPSSDIIDFLKRLGIEIYYFENDFLYGTDRLEKNALYSNKIYAINKRINTKHLLFLDSDIICLQSPNFSFPHIQAEFGARMAGRAKISLAQWHEIYKYFNLPFPQIMLPCLADNVLLPPYFNSGVFIISAKYKDRLFHCWQNYYKQLLSSKILVGNSIIYADQAALALAVISLDIDFILLDESYNYRSGQKRVPPDDLPVFAHYHSPHKIRNDPYLRKLVEGYIKRYPIIKAEISKSETWKIFFGKKKNYLSFKMKNYVKRLFSFDSK
jgi:hypothetical protein